MKEFIITIAVGLLFFWLALNSHDSACRLIEETNRNHKIFVELEGITEGGYPKQYLLGRWSHRGLMKCASDTFETSQMTFLTSFVALAVACLLLLDDPFDLHQLKLRRFPILRREIAMPSRLIAFVVWLANRVRAVASRVLRSTAWLAMANRGLINLNIARTIAGCLIFLPSHAMHNVAVAYATDPGNPLRLATSRNINFAASLMDMGAGALILIGGVPLVVSHFVRQPRRLSHEIPAQIALPPPTTALHRRT